MERFAFEILALLVIGGVLGMMAHHAFLRLNGAIGSRDATSTMEFRFDDRELVGACKQAQRSLSAEDFDGPLYDRMMSGLSAVFPDLTRRIEANTAHWDSFSLSASAGNKMVGLDVVIRDTLLTLRLSGIDAPLSKKMLVDADKVRADTEELAILRDAVSASPFPMWSEQADGKVSWHNRAYESLLKDAKLDKDTDHGKKLFHGGKITSAGETPSAKRSNVPLKNGEIAAFEVMRIAQETKTLNYATDASKLIKTEDSLRQFMQTLSQTFAALPIGLAVFDHARNLVMFNPALADLTTMDPAWLTARPSLHDVVDQLRELRMIPERRDFSDWRGKIAELDKLAVDGTYCETWALPNGQIYRFTGQPHPEGAVAFLIEDITAEISLTRKFRRELALSQALIDHLPNALIVFGSDGVIASTNTAYNELWNTDPEDVTDQLTITDATRLWQSKSTPNPVWGDARDFAVQGGERAEWSDAVYLKSGRRLQCRFQPLPGGSTLVEFSLAQPGAEVAAHHSKLAAVSH